MKTKFTEGAWKYRPAISTSCFYIETVDQSHDRSFIGEIGGGLQRPFEIEANAKLVVAAPILLEACIKALEHHQGGHSEIGFILREAIKKATE